MPVVKMGSGAQTQAKHCQGRGEGDRFGCQVQFTFLSAFVSEEGKEKVKPVAPVYLHLFFVFFGFSDGALYEESSQNQRKTHFVGYK